MAREALRAIAGDIRDCLAAAAVMAAIACLCLALAPDAALAMTIIQPACPAERLNAVWWEGLSYGLAGGIGLGCVALLVLAIAAQGRARRRAYPFDDGSAASDHPDVAAAIEASASKRSGPISMGALAAWTTLAFAAAAAVDMGLRAL